MAIIRLIEATHRFTVAAVKGARLIMDLFVPGKNGFQTIVPFTRSLSPCQDIEEWKGFSADVALVIPGTSVSYHVLHHV